MGDTLDESTPLRPKRNQAHKQMRSMACLVVFCFASFIFFNFFISVRVSVNVLSSVSEVGKTERDGYFILENYDQNKPFASFLPSMAGAFGTPLWAFYVNRGQGISSFGYRTKDIPVMEFETANKAYQETAFTGFRSVVKVIYNNETTQSSQPFFPGPSDSRIKRQMIIGLNELEIQEINENLGLQTNIIYFVLPGEDFAGLVRQTTFQNLNPESLRLEIVDGMIQIQPAGVTDGVLKTMGNTVQAWMEVYNLENRAPFYRVVSEVGDNEQVKLVTEGSYSLAFREQTLDSTQSELLTMIVDPFSIFGPSSPLMEPSLEFRTKSLNDILQAQQSTGGRTPCAMSGLITTLAPGESVTLSSIYGHTSSQDRLQNHIVPTLLAPGFLKKKRALAQELTRNMTDIVKTLSGSPRFDGFVRQSMLDNSLRGGYPLLLGNSPKVYHTFSRIHGDLERDYNYFVIEPTYYSQGPGNFRDINQNRRSDILFEPQIDDFNIRTFFSLIQADGYNPLTIQSTTFSLSVDDVWSIAAIVAGNGTDAEKLRGLLFQSIIPGILLSQIKDQDIHLYTSLENLLELITTRATQNVEASYSQGFWVDHWTYNLDHIRSYLAIYPDKQISLLWDSAPFPFYISPAHVQSRNQKYVLINGKPHQINAVVWDQEKQGSINSHGNAWQHTPYNTVFKVPLISKLVTLAVVKFSTTDPYGMGIEMEAGKPGWLDALNGLPSILGSCMSTTFEVVRLLQFLIDSVTIAHREVSLPIEVDSLLNSVNGLLTWYQTSGDDFGYWDGINNAREAYRDATRITFNGATVSWTHERLLSSLTSMLNKLQKGIDRAIQLNGGLTPTYFIWEMTSYNIWSYNWQGQPLIRPNSFTPHPLPLFLEGFVRQLKILPSVSAKKNLYQQVRHSDLYDTQLQMYRLSTSLSNQTLEIGRLRAFSPGLLERESIWLHMSFKFYLELLRGNLFEEFWEEARTGLVPFMDPKIYGRSPLECSSWLVSSANAEVSLHGAGHSARLSGATAEFLSMWNLIVIGPTPFVLNHDHTLHFTLRPAIPAWLFTQEKTFTFYFLSKIRVTYFITSENVCSTWDTKIQHQKIIITLLNGTEVMFDTESIASPYSELIRKRKVVSVDKHLFCSV